MQEEVEQRIVSLMISCGKLGEQEFRKAVAKLLEQLKNGHIVMPLIPHIYTVTTFLQTALILLLLSA